uniref:probable serine/threonine-protein kinase PBL10 n=1 Tax=Erigeron canadensis TaxID=72917 RepID=UPI001CB92C9B|nr:probable serine/threonine-protein kinase PBL10 [Erigeron canadensis]
MHDHSWEIVAGDLIKFTYGEMARVTRNFGDHISLGKDGFGKLYKGWVDKMTYSPCKDDTGLPVVVRKLFQYRHFDLEMMKKNYRHPNLVKLIGYCLEGEKLLLVHEFMHNGNFDELLGSGAVARLSLATKVKIAVGIARGIVFLNNMENFSESGLYRYKIMLDKEFTAKLSDYDVTKIVYGYCTCAYDKGDPSYYYPGCGPLLLQSNLSGFEVVFAEILTGKRIFLEKENWLEFEENYYYKNLAKICYTSCNDMDSESRMLTILKEFDKMQSGPELIITDN